MTITEAHTAEHFATIEDLAWRIVPDFYASFFVRTAAEYLVESGHTAVAVAAQAAVGCKFFLIAAGWNGDAADLDADAGRNRDAAELDADAGRDRDAAELDADAGRPVGYFSLAAEGDVVVLGHFYVLPECRGRGLGQLAMEFVDRQVRAMGVRRIELLVLRKNIAAVGLYRKNGYTVAEEVLTTLGNGAVLEDYLMRKEVEN